MSDGEKVEIRIRYSAPSRMGTGISDFADDPYTLGPVKMDIGSGASSLVAAQGLPAWPVLEQETDGGLGRALEVEYTIEAPAGWIGIAPGSPSGESAAGKVTWSGYAGRKPDSHPVFFIENAERATNSGADVFSSLGIATVRPFVPSVLSNSATVLITAVEPDSRKLGTSLYSVPV